jgi:hypothetical protein
VPGPRGPRRRLWSSLPRFGVGWIGGGLCGASRGDHSVGGRIGACEALGLHPWDGRNRAGLFLQDGPHCVEVGGCVGTAAPAPRPALPSVRPPGGRLD